MHLTHAATADRHLRIARAVAEQPSRSLRQIAEDFKVTHTTVRRACRAYQVPTSWRPSRKWKEGTATWLHTGDVLMRYSSKRLVEILGMVYHDDLTVSYICRPALGQPKGRARYIHENTLKTSYTRISTTERKLPDERFLQWTFGPLN